MYIVQTLTGDSDNVEEIILFGKWYITRSEYDFVYTGVILLGIIIVILIGTWVIMGFLRDKRD